MRPGDTLAERYRLIDLLDEARGGRFWHAWDQVLARQVAIHLIAADDSRAVTLLDAARNSARLSDPRLLRVLDAGTLNSWCYVVNEWGEGHSLDEMVAEEPLPPRRAAWIVGEVAELIAAANRIGLTHGRLVPDSVMIDERGAVKVVGFAVDAALHGIKPADSAHEMEDLVGLLYAALTARWPGHSSCRMAAAPKAHGELLRPRQVRAGVPRALDQICDGVLNPAHAVTAHTPRDAAGVASALFDFVGDRHAAAEAEAIRQGGNTSSRLPQIPAAPQTPTAAPATVDEVAAAVVDKPDEDATQVGLPTFDDEVLDAEWRTPSPEPPPPPPPFEDSPERPLFAPAPPEGRPARVPRADVAPADSSYWPWETEAGSTPAIAEPEEEPEPVPGRGWLRGAGILAVALLVLVAMVYGFNRGRSDADGSDDPDPSPSDSGRTATVAINPAAVADFDPLGDPREENPDLVALAHDGDPTTQWQTQGYRDQFAPDGFKSGVGLLIDLGAEREVREVVVHTAGGRTGIELYASDQETAPVELSELTRVAKGATRDNEVRLVPKTTVPERWLVVWLVSLPGDGEFRGRISEVEIRT